MKDGHFTTDRLGDSMIMKSCPSFRYDIYIAGDYNHAKQLLQKFVEIGLCVSVTKTDFVYKYGQEAGVKVTLINYPRFPTTEEELKTIAIDIGHYLMDNMAQGSFTVYGPETTIYFDRR